jgi:rfaE bifunctional protein nucleotidyltransferase chain/domain
VPSAECREVRTASRATRRTGYPGAATRSNRPARDTVPVRAASKVKTVTGVVRAVRRMQAEGRRVVFTNGCFDLLHRGHIRYLEQARSLGDALVVAINSDRSVRMLKGPERPVVPDTQRAEVVAALAAVDYVVVFDELDPARVIRAVRPDVLVKGGDWPISQIVGADFVQSRGGQVLSLPYVEGASTSALIGRILGKAVKRR